VPVTPIIDKHYAEIPECSQYQTKKICEDRNLWGRWSLKDLCLAAEADRKNDDLILMSKAEDKNQLWTLIP